MLRAGKASLEQASIHVRANFWSFYGGRGQHGQLGPLWPVGIPKELKHTAGSVLVPVTENSGIQRQSSYVSLVGASPCGQVHTELLWLLHSLSLMLVLGWLVTKADGVIVSP